MRVEELVDLLQEHSLNDEVSFISIHERGRGSSWIEVEHCEVFREDGKVYVRVSGDVDEDGGSD